MPQSLLSLNKLYALFDIFHRFASIFELVNKKLLSILLQIQDNQKRIKTQIPKFKSSIYINYPFQIEDTNINQANVIFWSDLQNKEQEGCSFATRGPLLWLPYPP